MTKRSLNLSVAAIVLFSLVAYSATAELSETQKQEIQSVFADKTIKITEENETIIVAFPKVTAQDKNGKNKTVAAYQLHLKETESFNGMPQYKYMTVSPIRLKALVHSWLSFPSVIAEADSFAEEASIVPALGYESGKKMQIVNLRLFDEEDEKLNKFLSASKITRFIKSRENSGSIDYFSVFKGENFMISSMLGNLHIPGFVSAIDMKNAVLKKGQKMPMLADDIKSSLKTTVITLDVLMLSIVVNFRIDSEARLVLNKNEGTIDVVSLFRFKDLEIKENNTFLNSKEKNIPSNSFLKFWIKGIDRQKYEKLQDKQQNNILALDEDNDHTDEISELSWHSLLSGKEIKYKFSALFEQGAINGNGYLKIKKDEMINVMQFEIVNFDILSPDTGKACRARQAKNPSDMASECPSGGFLDFLRPYVDINKRIKNDKGQTVDKFIVRQSNAENTINGKPAAMQAPSLSSLQIGSVKSKKTKNPVQNTPFFYCKIIVDLGFL